MENGVTASPCQRGCPLVEEIPGLYDLQGTREATWETCGHCFLGEDALAKQKGQLHSETRSLHVGYVASVEQPDMRLDDQEWVGILRSRGHVVSIVAWNDAKVDWRVFNILITRLTYHHLNPTGFRRWLDLVDSLHEVAVLNPTNVHRWNQDKRYLQQLELIGIPTIPTVWLTRGVDSASVLDQSSLLSHKDLVIKPTISSVARGLCRIDRSQNLALREAIDRTLEWSDAMVQPFISSIQSCGEIRCVFLGSEFSHAVQKLPLPGDFRTNISDNWKLLDRLQFPEYDSVVAAAKRALEGFLSLTTSSSSPDFSCLLFAAVDILLDINKRPLLIELEMTDPSLYLMSSGHSLANLFAKYIISKATVYRTQQYAPLSGPRRPIFPWQGPEVLFVRQALQTPSAIALTSDVRFPVTYWELCRRAVCVSKYISARKFTSIAILCQRTPDLISTIMGCMFARVTYLLLNGSLPTARTKAMLKLSGIRHVLCDHSEGHITELHHHRIEAHLIGDITASTANVQIDELYEGLLCREPLPDRINNFIFTSGSTGVPKGIQIRYEAVANVVQHFINDILAGSCGASVVFAHSTNVTFDISAIPFFVPLAVGGRIALASDRCLRDPSLLKGFLYSNQSNYTLATTSQYRLLIESGWVPAPGDVCIQAGEVLSQKVASCILGAKSMLWNFYGPAETTIWSTGCFVQNATDPISIGLPIWNTEVVLLDDAGNVSDEGEICIAGVGVGQYIHVTKHAGFHSISLSESNPESKSRRFYRTGDFARYSKGKLFYRGRVDTQIKIGGQRMELQEIELALERLPKVLEAVIKHKIDGSQEGRLVAFVSPVLDAVELKGMLTMVLPNYMVPSHFIFLESFPLNSSGKIDTKVLMEHYGMCTATSSSTGSGSETPFSMSPGVLHGKRLQELLLAVFCQELGLHKSQMNASDNIFDHGTTSILAVRMAQELSKHVGMDISVADIFENPSASQLGEKISLNNVTSGDGILQNSTLSANLMKDIAVISLALRCPSARSPEELWRIIMEGTDTVFIPNPSERPPSTSWIEARTSLTDSLDFDRTLFNMTKTQAQLTDPQQRLFLECAYEALESSGYTADDQNLRVGVFAAAPESTYFRHMLANVSQDQATNHLIQTGTDMDYISSLTAFKLNCRGPSLTIGTACSGSSVAIALACDSLRAGRCDMAVAGGASIRFPAHNGYVFTDGYIHSHDGRCRPFDENASGTVMTDGVGVIVLKPLSTAVADRDNVLAVIKGYGVLNDGSQKANLHSPSVQGQCRTMHDALMDAGVSANDVSYVETHGTGTVVGDAIEFQAISEVLGNRNRELCQLGAIKANIGHTNSASGVFGLIKLSLCLQWKNVPPLANFSGNPGLGGLQTRLSFPMNAMHWTLSGEQTKRIGLALSTGFGGTNAAFVLEEYDQHMEHIYQQNTEHVSEAVILPLSAATATALRLKRIQLAGYLEGKTYDSLLDVSFTLQNGRRALPFRQTFVVNTVDRAVALLRTPDDQIPHHVNNRASLLFVFPGQGFQCLGLGTHLYEFSTVFRQALEDCLEILDQYHISSHVRQMLLQKGEVSMKCSEDGNVEHSLQHIIQPALFVLEYSIACLACTAFGIPDGVLGHSFGEIVAACISGAISLQSALALAVTRGRLMGRLPRGGMLSVRVSKLDCSLLAAEHGLSIAAENGPESFVLSGELSAIREAETKLQDMGITARNLGVTHAFHSKMMDNILDELLEAIMPHESTFKPPAIPLFSTVTGTQWESDLPISATHWAKHIRQPVLFSTALQIASQKFPRVLVIEMGPKVLSTLIQQQSYEKRTQIGVVDILPPQGTSIHEKMLITAGKVWESGDDAVLDRYHASLPKRPGHGPRRTKLPTYPFERAQYAFPQSTDNVLEEKSCQIKRAKSDKRPKKSGALGDAVDLSAAIALEHWVETESSKHLIEFPGVKISKDLSGILSSTARFRSLIEQVRGCAKMQPLLNSQAMRHIHNTLQSFKLTNTGSLGEHDSQAFLEAGISDKYVRFCTRLVQLSRASAFVPVPDGQTHTAPDSKIVEQDIIETCGNELTAIIRGNTSPHHILFPILEDHYRSYPFHALSNFMAAALVRQSMQAIRPLRVLEVGAGTASFTSELLSQESLGAFELYLFTDVSRAFFAEANDQFSSFPYFQTQVLDLEVHPALQGFDAGSFDIVVGSNSVHTVKDISKTLRHINWLIRPGGVLVLVEIFEPEIWQEFVFGVLPGWWHFEDLRVRQSSLLLGREAWGDALRSAGFSDVRIQPATEFLELGQPMKQGVVTARKAIQSLNLDALEESPTHWCQILLDDHSVSAALPGVLRHHDVHCILERDVNTDELQSALHTAQSAGQKCCIILGYTTPGYEMLYDFDEENRKRMQRDTCLPLLRQLQRLADIDPEDLTALRIIVVTRSAQGVTKQNTGNLNKLQLLGSLVLGICRSAVQEIPSIELIAVDLDVESDPQTDAVVIAREVFTGRPDPEVAYRQSKRYARRIVSGPRLHEIVRQKVQNSDNYYNIRPDATYVITGSSGGLGQLITRDLLQRGAKHLLLLSRSLEKHDFAGLDLPQTCHVACVDVGDLGQLSAIFKQMRTVMPPICTVFHAAGTLSDAAIINQTWETFETVLRSKVDGTLNLIHALADNNLDHFVLFGSIVGALGNPGQVNHAAACSFQSSIARLLASQGRSVTAIEWGPWRDIGAASSPNVLARLLQKGLESISPTEGLAALRAMTYPTTANINSACTASLIIARVDWTRFGNSLPAYARQGLFESTGLTTPVFNTHDKTGATDATQLPAPRDIEFESKTEQKVFQIVVKVLGLSHKDLSLTTPLSEYGLDSLSVITMVRHLNQKMAVRFRPQQFLAISKCTIKGLANLVDKQLKSDVDPLSNDQGLVSLSKGVEGNVPVFLFHGAGGAVHMLQDFATSLSVLTGRAGIALWPPGLSDEHYEADIESLACRYTNDIMKYCSGPYDFVGYSLGGGIAVACANLLYRDHKIHVRNLVLLDTPTPSAMRLGGLATTSDVHQYLTELDPSLHLRYESFEKFGKLFLHHCQTYKAWKPYISAGVKHIFFVKCQERKGEWEPLHPEVDWMQLTTQKISTGVAPGNHSTMLSELQGSALANLVWEYLRTACQND